MKKEKDKSVNKFPYAKKSLGQNFLTDRNYIDRIVSSLNPQKGETIVEIGAGRGALTESIVRSGAKTLAIEIDRNLILILFDKFAEKENFHLIEKDALEIDFESLVALQSSPQKTKLVANLPYYISTAILQHLIQYRNSFSEMILMLQKEVVERIAAAPGNKERGFLTVLIQNYFAVETLFDVSPNAFRPVPKVRSAVIRFKARKDCMFNATEIKLFRDLVSCGFAQKRKTLRNNLKNIKGELEELIVLKGGVISLLEKAEIEPNIRAEALSVKKWRVLLEILST